MFHKNPASTTPPRGRVRRGARSPSSASKASVRLLLPACFSCQHGAGVFNLLRHRERTAPASIARQQGRQQRRHAAFRGIFITRAALHRRTRTCTFREAPHPAAKVTVRRFAGVLPQKSGQPPVAATATMVTGSFLWQSRGSSATVALDLLLEQVTRRHPGQVFRPHFD